MAVYLQAQRPLFRKPLRFSVFVLAAFLFVSASLEAQRIESGEERGTDTADAVQTVKRSVKDHDGSLASLYTNYAASAFRDGNYDRADAMAETALMFSSELPDALYIRGEAAYANSDFDTAASRFSRALLYDRWRLFRTLPARTRLAAVYYRLGRTGEAYHLLYPRYSEVSTDREAVTLYVKILSGLGFTDRAKEEVARAQKRFSEDPALQELRTRFDIDYRRRVLRLIREGDSEELFYRPVYRSVILTVVNDILRKNRPPKDAEGLCALYEQRWGEDRFSSIYSLWPYAVEENGGDAESANAEAGKREEEAEQALVGLFEKYEEFEGEEIEFIREIARESAGESARESAGAPAGAGQFGLTGSEILEAAGFSGRFVYDTNDDGFYEKRAFFDGAKLTRIEWDEDQNTRPETVIYFDNGTPERFVIGEEDKNEGIYGEYPNLVEVFYSMRGEETSDRGKRRGTRLVLVPYQVDFDILIGEENDILSPPSLPENRELPPIEELLPYAAKIDRTAEKSTVHYDAQTARSVIYPVSMDGRSIEGRYAGPRLEERLRDIDGDGVEEISEQYRNGQLVSLWYDGNGNDTPEYVEIYEEVSATRLWDVDEDGVFDYEMKIRHYTRGGEDNSQ